MKNSNPNPNPNRFSIIWQKSESGNSCDGNWKERRKVETMREFQGKVERSSSKRRVRPISVTTHLSLSPSMIVRSKSNSTTTVVPDIPGAEAGFLQRPEKERNAFVSPSLCLVSQKGLGRDKRLFEKWYFILIRRSWVYTVFGYKILRCF